MTAGIWIQLGRDFINFCKQFLLKAERRKIFFNELSRDNNFCLNVFTTQMNEKFKRKF
jgi:hypothetical protein